jgi:hypothetical protein
MRNPYLPANCRIEDFDGATPRELYIERCMIETANEALDSLSKVVHAPYLESFAKLLDYAQNEHEPEAMKIVSQLHLKEEHFYALRGDYEAFELYMYENEPERVYAY